MDKDAQMKTFVNKWIDEALAHERSVQGWPPNARNRDYLKIHTPQQKGKIGTKVYAQWLTDQGFEVEIIEGKELSGDLRYRLLSTDSWTVTEVKLSKCTLKTLRCGFINLSLWWNQIRPRKKWDEIALVGIYPNHCRIWRKSREEWDRDCEALSTCSEKGHTGTDDLWKVNFRRNKRTDNFSEWKEVYSTQQGAL